MSKRKTIDHPRERKIPGNENKLTLKEHRKIYFKAINDDTITYYGAKKDYLNNKNNGDKNKSGKSKNNKNKTDKPINNKPNYNKPNYFLDVTNPIKGDLTSKQPSKSNKSTKPSKLKIRKVLRKKRNKVYESTQNVLDDIREWRSSKIISNLSNNLGTIIMKIARDNNMSNFQMNIMRSSIALVTSEVLNQIFEEPLKVYKNIKLFIKVGKNIYKVITWFNENSELLELKKEKIIKVSSSSYQYKKFLRKYPKTKKLYEIQTRESKILGKKISVIVTNPKDFNKVIDNSKFYLNYGFIPNAYNSIGEKQMSYIIDELEFLEEFKGRVVAIIRRKNEIDTKWIVSNSKIKYSIKEIQQIMKTQGEYSRAEIEVWK